MTGLGVAAALIVAGAALVVQNGYLLKTEAVAGSVWAALWLNSLVGLALLSTVLVTTDGMRSMARLLASPCWWFVLPGLLGTLYVFAALRGYAQFGAVITVSLLVASQLIAGVVFDLWRGNGVGGTTLLGVCLLVLGVALVLDDG